MRKPAFITPKNWQGRIAKRVGEEYNVPQRNSFSLVPPQEPFFIALAPLRQGETVILIMDDPRFATLKNYKGRKGRNVVILTPGTVLGPKSGLSNRDILVSILGLGSCMIRVDSLHKGYKSANLVLAGMPAKLANVLMAALQQVFR